MRTPLRSIFSAWLVSLVLLLFSRPLFAGTVRIEDAPDKLDTTGESALVSKGAGLPFDALVMVTTQYSTAADLDRAVGGRVNAPNLVVVGVDPERRRTSVHFGTGVGVSQADFKAVEQAGIPFFKTGDFAGGIGAILEKAKTARATNAGSSPPSSGSSSPSTSSGSAIGIGIAAILFFLVIGAVVFGAIIIAIRAACRSARPSPQWGRPGYGAGYGQGPYPQGGPGWGQQQSGYGSAATHGAAALGGAAVGYAAGRYFSESSSSSDASSTSSWNSGSSGGSYDSGGSSSSYDSGGSTSSWDSSSSSSDSSSSSFDSGSSGGSFDSGGSTSDW